MRYIKTYEYISRPQKGEYVICEEGSGIPEVINFLEQNIGKIVDIDGNKFEVLYDNVPPELDYSFYKGKRLMEIHEIMHHSFDIEILEAILSGNKYNL